MFQRNDNFVGTIVYDIAAANIGQIGIIGQKARLLAYLNGSVQIVDCMAQGNILQQPFTRPKICHGYHRTLHAVASFTINTQVIRNQIIFRPRRCAFAPEG